MLLGRLGSAGAKFARKKSRWLAMLSADTSANTFEQGRRARHAVTA
jgi:hypothetical protein